MGPLAVGESVSKADAGDGVHAFACQASSAAPVGIAPESRSVLDPPELRQPWFEHHCIMPPLSVGDVAGAANECGELLVRGLGRCDLEGIYMHLAARVRDIPRLTHD